MPVARLKTYRRVLAYYHLHPESKFDNGDYTDHGATVRRHVEVTAIDHIGKEAHRWEEQFFLGRDPDARLEYGISPNEHSQLKSKLLQVVKTHGVTAIARAAGVSRQHVSAIITEKTIPSAEVLFGLCCAGATVETDRRAYEANAQAVILQVSDCCTRTSLRNFASLAEVNAGHLARILSGKRRAPKAMLTRLKRAVARYRAVAL